MCSVFEYYRVMTTRVSRTYFISSAFEEVLLLIIGVLST